jgi:hypothetical protein
MLLREVVQKRAACLLDLLEIRSGSGQELRERGRGPKAISIGRWHTVGLTVESNELDRYEFIT